MHNTKIALALISLALTGCRIRSVEPAVETKQPNLIVHVRPGQKLVEIGRNGATVWTQTRAAHEDEEFGSILHTDYDAATGQRIREILFIEHADTTTAKPAPSVVLKDQDCNTSTDNGKICDKQTW